MFKKAIAALATVFALFATVASACPDWQGRPHFGSIELRAGFLPDPFVRNVTAGGTINLPRCINNTAGFVTQRPDFDLYWSGSAAQLTIAIESRADAVLLVNAPDGSWWFDDDTYGTDPVLTFYDPQPGLYDIWIGSYDGSRRNPARLVITEYNY